MERLSLEDLLGSVTHVDVTNEDGTKVLFARCEVLSIHFGARGTHVDVFVGNHGTRTLPARRCWPSELARGPVDLDNIRIVEGLEQLGKDVVTPPCWKERTMATLTERMAAVKYIRAQADKYSRGDVVAAGFRVIARAIEDGLHSEGPTS